jgi:hypothetical protein
MPFEVSLSDHQPFATDSKGTGISLFYTFVESAATLGSGLAGQAGGIDGSYR